MTTVIYLSRILSLERNAAIFRMKQQNKFSKINISRSESLEILKGIIIKHRVNVQNFATVDKTKR